MPTPILRAHAEQQFADELAALARHDDKPKPPNWKQDMRYYGALRKQIPFTFWAMIAGTLAKSRFRRNTSGSAE